MSEDTKYMITRFYQDDRPREVLVRGLTLEQAQEHCSREDTHGEGWFDGYDVDDEPGWDELGRPMGVGSPPPARRYCCDTPLGGAHDEDCPRSRDEDDES